LDKRRTLIAASERVGKLPPYLFAELDRQKALSRRKGVDLIDFGIGDPDAPTPKPVVRACAEALEDPRNHRYPDGRGSGFYLEACRRWLAREFGVEKGVEVSALIGSKEGLAHLPMVFCNPGDVVLVPNPGYPVYRAAAILADATPVDVPLLRANGFLPDLTELNPAVLKRARILFLNYPNNPTGAVLTRGEMEEIVELARREDIMIVSDNSYSHIRFDGESPQSFLQVPGAVDICLELHSFSKTFNMTGWRVGFMAGSPNLVSTFMGVKENLDSGVFTAVQRAAASAVEMDSGHLESMLEMYGRRRSVLVGGLRDLGWDVCDTSGTFYVWAALPRKTDSMAFARRLISRTGIVVTPGSGFGTYGEGYVRFALTIPEERIHKALGRLEGKEMASLWRKMAPKSDR
jgi:LL-diaminopimelate aminotransferase